MFARNTERSVLDNMVLVLNRMILLLRKSGVREDWNFAVHLT